MRPTHYAVGHGRTFVYNAPDTISRYMQSNAFGRLIAGPVGSGKTTGSIIELTKRQAQQMPAPIDGKRYTRFAIIRQTLQQLKATVLKDVLQRFGSIAEWRVSESTLYWREGDIHSEWMFIPLDEPDDKKRLLSTNLTAAFINESIEIDIDLLSDIAGRCGRFPNEEFGVPTWRGIMCDTNMPTRGTRWAKFMKEGLAGIVPEWDMFVQPGGRTEDAENLNHLEQTPETLLLSESDPERFTQGRKYYARLVATGTPDYIQRYVDAQFGDDPSGSAVYKESYTYNFHVRDTVEPVDDRMLIIGQDFWRNPAALICQLTSKGVLLVLEEVASYSMGLHQHIEERLKPVLTKPRYIGKRFVVVGDPSGRAKNSILEFNEFEYLSKLGLPNFPAATNDVDRRIRAVEGLFLRNVAGGPAIIIDESRCPVLVEGLNGSYKYPKNKEGVDKANPEKDTPWSHIQDALQYVALTCATPESYNFAFSATVIQKPIARQPMVSARGWT